MVADGPWAVTPSDERGRDLRDRTAAAEGHRVSSSRRKILARPPRPLRRRPRGPRRTGARQHGVRPSASAFTMSVPRRPPVDQTGTRPATAPATSGRAGQAGGRPVELTTAVVRDDDAVDTHPPPARRPRRLGSPTRSGSPSALEPTRGRPRQQGVVRQPRLLLTPDPGARTHGEPVTMRRPKTWRSTVRQIASIPRRPPGRACRSSRPCPRRCRATTISARRTRRPRPRGSRSSSTRRP